MPLPGTRLPNFLFLGPDKSGSTWLYEVLRAHPEVYMSPAKELFFFDRFYDKGFGWYSRHFKGVRLDHRIVGEVSHDYLFSVVACERIANDLPDVRLMVCLREPTDRAFSAYLYMIRQGRVRAPFAEAIHTVPELIDHGMYAKHLKPYWEKFGPGRLFVGIFDDLKADPQVFASKLFRFLGVSEIQLTRELRGKTLEAARPRSFWVAKLLRTSGWAIRTLGMPTLVTRVKSSSTIQRILYQPYTAANRPVMPEDVRTYLRALFLQSVRELDALLGTDLVTRWGYADECRR